MHLIMIEQEREKLEAMLGKAAEVPAAELKEVDISAAESAPVVDGVARVGVRGVLTKSPNALLRWFGVANTAYSDLKTQVLQADADPEVNKIVLDVESGGGEVRGLFDVMDTIAGVNTRVEAHITDMAASAAYGIASQADHIEATGRGDYVGSVGVVASYYVSDRVVDVTSTNAPNKRPDASTEEGRAAIRAQLDQTHDLFVEGIARGRGVSVDKVNADFGRGGVMVAGSALDAGMIDKVRGQSAAGVSNSKAANRGEEEQMDLNKLKVEHPDVYDAAVQDGVDKERDRVGAHLTYGANGGEKGMARAIEACKKGDELTHTCMAEYMTAAQNHGDTEKRADDNSEAEAADESNAADDTEETADATFDAVLAAVSGKQEA